MTRPERDAWTAIYRLYEKHAEALRRADPEAAVQIFDEVTHDVTAEWDGMTDPARLILLTGVGLLDDVWKSSHKNSD